MDTLKTVGISAVVAIAAVLGLSFTSGGEELGYQLIPGVSMTPANVTTLTQGGGVYATSTAGNSTLLTEAIDDENVIDMTLTGGAGTLTFMASSSVPGMSNPGDTRTIYIRNASTSVNALLTVAVGTGMTLKNAASSTALLIGDTDGDNTMRVDLIRKSDTDINVLFMKHQD